MKQCIPYKCRRANDKGAKTKSRKFQFGKMRRKKTINNARAGIWNMREKGRKRKREKEKI